MASGALPLVTLTLTTDEMAMASAGLLLLRREWNERAMHSNLQASQRDYDEAMGILKNIAALRSRLEELVTQEHGADLLGELIRDLRRKPRD